MNVRSAATLGLLFFAACATRAEVVHESEAGFELRYEVVTSATADVTFAALVDVASWWDPAHTYGGKAQGMTLSLVSGGCLCEKFEGGEVEHLRVVYLAQGRALRWQGGLGPLQALPVNGVMDWLVEPRDTGSRLTMRYLVGGTFGQSPTATEWANIVDGVLQGQFDRLTEEVKTRCKACAP